MNPGVSAGLLPDLSAAQTEQLRQTAEVLLRCLGPELMAVYLHGSAVTSGLRPESDLDVLAVTGRSLTDDQRRTLLSGLLDLSPPHPGTPDGPRRMEVIVVVAGPNAIADDSTLMDFVYGEWLRSEFLCGALPRPQRAADAVLLRAQAATCAVPLLGDDALPHLSIIPPEAIRIALLEALPQLVSALRGDERNVLLTLARMWWTASTGTFTSKDQAASWAGARLSGEAQDVLDLARRAYLGQTRDNWNTRHEAARRTAETLQGRIAGSLSQPSPTETDL